MEYLGCYDSVMDIVAEATEEFQGTYSLNKNKFDALEDICDAIDAFVEENGCNFMDVSVEKNSKQLTVDIGRDDIILQDGRSSQFFSLIQLVDSFSFSKTENGALCIALNIAGLWERV